jgi:beta-mannosidase
MTRIFLLILFFPILIFAQTERQNINSNWGFKHTDSTQWQKASVPGCIHTDLYANKLIPDPFYGDNEKNCNGLKSKNGFMKPLLM